MNSFLYRKNQIKHLSTKIKCGHKDITWVLENLELCFHEFDKRKRDKASGKLKTYADGTVKIRTISASRGKLKKIQKGIKENILDGIKVPVHIQGSTKGKSNITNAKLHKGKKFKFGTDLKDYFPSISSTLIFEAFQRLNFTREQSKLLTQLTILYKGLPQGAPTSSALSNLCFLDIDFKLLEICASREITYSRYIDDLQFSSQKDFKYLTPLLIRTIEETGFKVNHRKTSYSNQTITGLIVFNNFIDVTNELKEKAKTENVEDTQKPFRNYMNQVRKSNINIKSKPVKNSKI